MKVPSGIRRILPERHLTPTYRAHHGNPRVGRCAQRTLRACRNDLWLIFRRAKKKPQTAVRSGVSYRSLTMTYSHMVKHHTTIGDASFHY